MCFTIVIKGYIEIVIWYLHILTRKHSSGMNTTRFSDWGWCLPTEAPLTKTPLRMRTPPPKEHGTRDTKPPRTNIGPGSQTGSACEQNDWQTGVKTLPFPKLRLRAVKTNFHFKLQLFQNVDNPHKEYLHLCSIFDHRIPVYFELETQLKKVDLYTDLSMMSMCTEAEKRGISNGV